MNIFDEFWIIAEKDELETNRSKREQLPAGYYEFYIQDYELFKSKQNKPYIKLNGFYILKDSSKLEGSIYLKIDERFFWKIKNLFISTETYDYCFDEEGRFFTNWDALVSMKCYCIYDDKGLKNFITKEEYLKVS